MSANCVSVVAEPSPSVKTIAFLGIKIDLITPLRLLDLVSDCIAAGRKVVIAHHNLHSLCLHSSSSRDAVSLRRSYDRAEYTLADGMSMVALGRLLGHPIGIRHRVAYNDWLPFMLPIAVQREWRIFYLGSTPDAAARGAEMLCNRFPGLQLGVHHGHFDARYESDDNAKVVAEISRHRPHILFVGMGVPRQESWIQENLNEIDANVILPSGATLDYIAGAKRMAPRWMGKLGLEWAFRLATEPRRLAFRYLVEPWGLLSAVLTNNLAKSREAISPIGSESSE
jgi:N-acetylglucosaminyldiphosphoundecaprenol N-acetyl-beta-D-mannosaminyltransferase